MKLAVVSIVGGLVGRAFNAVSWGWSWGRCNAYRRDTCVKVHVDDCHVAAPSKPKRGHLSCVVSARHNGISWFYYPRTGVCVKIIRLARPDARIKELFVVKVFFVIAGQISQVLTPL